MILFVSLCQAYIWTLVCLKAKRQRQRKTGSTVSLAMYGSSLIREPYRAEIMQVYMTTTALKASPVPGRREAPSDPTDARQSMCLSSNGTVSLTSNSSRVSHSIAVICTSYPTRNQALLYYPGDTCQSDATRAAEAPDRTASSSPKTMEQQVVVKTAEKKLDCGNYALEQCAP